MAEVPASTNAARQQELALWIERVAREGAAALLGSAHDRLQRAHLDHMPYAWAQRVGDQNGIPNIDRQATFRALLDAWMMNEASDEVVVQQILPAIRQANPSAFEAWPDESLQKLWRSAYPSAIRFATSSPVMLFKLADKAHVNGMTVSSLQGHLSERFGAPIVEGLIAGNRLELVEDVEMLPTAVRAGIRPNDLNSLAALTTPDGRIFLLASRIAAEAATGIFLHEVGEHAGLEAMLGQDYARISAQFDRLLRRGDPYARWASARVPVSTPYQQVASERIAYLVERVANDREAMPGGEDGFELGNEALSKLRTWLFRTPICRWLDNAGLLSRFNLTPQDITELCREAVTHVAADAGVTIPTPQDISQSLSADVLDAAFTATPAQRESILSALPQSQAVAYLYCLTALNAPAIAATVDQWRESLHQLRINGSDEDRAIAYAVLNESRRVDAAAEILHQRQHHGIAAWRQDAGAGQSDLFVLSPSAAYTDRFQLAQYRDGLIGVTELDQPEDISQAVDHGAAVLPVEDVAAAVGAEVAIGSEAGVEIRRSGQQVVVPGNPTQARASMSSLVGSLHAKCKKEEAELRRRLARIRSLPGGAPRYAAATKSALASVLRMQKQLVNWQFPAGEQLKPSSAPIGNEISASLRRQFGLGASSTYGELMQVAEQARYPEAIFAALGHAGVRGIEFEGEVRLVDFSSRRIAAELHARRSTRFHLAYHGSRHEIDQFSLDKIGTGEGSQAFGHGLYFASSRVVARHYQTLHKDSSVWYGSTCHVNEHDMSAAAIEDVLSRHPELASDPDARHFLGRVATMAVHDPFRAREALIPKAPEHLQAAGKYLMSGVLKASRDQFDRFFVMPANGARGLREILESEDRRMPRALHEIECSIYWRAKLDMSDEQLDQMLQQSIESITDTEALRQEIAELTAQLDRNPSDDFLHTRLRDLEWSLEAADNVAHLVEAYPDLKIMRPIGPGQLYAVDLDIEPYEYLQHDLPFNEQSLLVRNALMDIEYDPEVPELIRDQLSAARQQNEIGAQLYAALAGRSNTVHWASTEAEQRASQMLLEKGVQGVQYADGMTRNTDQSSHNYVVFSADRINILGKTTMVVSSDSTQIPELEAAVAKASRPQMTLRFG